MLLNCENSKKIGHIQSDESKYNFITVREVQVQSPEFKTRDPEFSYALLVCKMFKTVKSFWFDFTDISLTSGFVTSTKEVMLSSALVS